VLPRAIFLTDDFFFLGTAHMPYGSRFLYVIVSFLPPIALCCNKHFPTAPSFYPFFREKCPVKQSFVRHDALLVSIRLVDDRWSMLDKPLVPSTDDPDVYEDVV